VLSLLDALSDERSGSVPCQSLWAMVFHRQAFVFFCLFLSFHFTRHAFYVYTIYARPQSAQDQYSRSCSIICCPSPVYNIEADCIQNTSISFLFLRMHIRCKRNKFAEPLPANSVLFCSFRFQVFAAPLLSNDHISFSAFQSCHNMTPRRDE
jgi:hypothetical protein